MVSMTTIRIYWFLFLFGFLGDLRHNTRKEMNQAVEDFKAKMTSTVENLKARHSTERLQFLEKVKIAMKFLE